jgi:hypothetical protein
MISTKGPFRGNNAAMSQHQQHRSGTTLAALILATLMAAPGGAVCGEGAGAAGPDEEIEYLITGLDISYWADGNATVFGPGLTWGLVLLPERLHLLLTVGAMMGDGVYTVPVELRFDVHLGLTDWLDLYLAPGPTLLFDRFDGTWHHDLALSVGGGLSISPTGSRWALRVGGDYNLRLMREVRNGGGFTVGFNYRF